MAGTSFSGVAGKLHSKALQNASKAVKKGLSSKSAELARSGANAMPDGFKVKGPGVDLVKPSTLVMSNRDGQQLQRPDFASGIVTGMSDLAPKPLDMDSIREEAETRAREDAERSRLVPEFDAGYDPSKSVVGTLDTLGGDAPLSASTDTNRIYADILASEGYKPSQGDDWWDRAGTYLSKSRGATYMADAGGSMDPFAMANDAADSLDSAIQRYRTQAVDDGTLDDVNLTSNYMTRDQYIKYLEAGVPGRDIDEVRLASPDTVYNKRVEMIDHGFAPYIPNDAAYLKMAAQNVAAAPSDAASWVRGLRENIAPDYTIEIDGRTVSGNDFNPDRASTWLENASMNTSPVIMDIETGDVLPIGGDFAVDGNGNMVGSYYDSDGTLFAALDNGGYLVVSPDGTVTAPDGSSMRVEPGADGGEVFNNLIADENGNHSTPFVFSAAPLDKYVTEKGVELSADDVSRILSDRAYETGAEGYTDDEGVNWDFGKWNIGKPADMLRPLPMGGAENGTWDDFLPKAVDAGLSSSPYFLKQIAFPVAFSDSYHSLHEINPWQTTSDRVYKGHLGGIDPETRAAMEAQGIDVDKYEDYRHGSQYVEKAAANAIMPFTEYGWGSIGTKVANPLARRLASRYGTRAWYPTARLLSGVAGEGLEEVPGNAVEEATQNGFTKSWYMEPIRDPETNEVYTDENGNVLYWQDDPEKTRTQDFTGRIGRFLQDAPESMLYGAMLGGAATPFQVPSTINQTKANKILRQLEEEELMDPYSEYDDSYYMEPKEFHWNDSAD